MTIFTERKCACFATWVYTAQFFGGTKDAHGDRSAIGDQNSNTTHASVMPRDGVESNASS